MTALYQQEHVALRKLWWIVPLTILVAALANSLVRAVVVTFFGVAETFEYLQFSYIIGSTFVYVLLALLVFLLVGRFARRPLRFYRILALVALCVSFLSPVMLLTGQMPAVGMTIGIFWTMVTMHIVSALIVIGLFTILARE
jgi:hypothetical protein